jgi:hypothetical protein
MYSTSLLREPTAETAVTMGLISSSDIPTGMIISELCISRAFLILQRYPLGSGMQHRNVDSRMPSFRNRLHMALACDFFAAAFFR